MNKDSSPTTPGSTDPQKDPELKGPRKIEPDDRGLLGSKDFESWGKIESSIPKSEFWRSRCFDKEPALMAFAEGCHYNAIHTMGLKLKGLFHHQPWFAVVVHKALTEAFLMGLYFGERRFHSSPDNLIPKIEYPDPCSGGTSPMEEPPPEKDEVISDLEDDDFA